MRLPTQLSWTPPFSRTRAALQTALEDTLKLLALSFLPLDGSRTFTPARRSSTVFEKCRHANVKPRIFSESGLRLLPNLGASVLSWSFADLRSPGAPRLHSTHPISTRFFSSIPIHRTHSTCLTSPPVHLRRRYCDKFHYLFRLAMTSSLMATSALSLSLVLHSLPVVNPALLLNLYLYRYPPLKLYIDHPS